MQIFVEYIQCKMKDRVSEDKAGQVIRCKACGTKVRVPNDAEESSEQSRLPAPKKSSKRKSKRRIECMPRKISQFLAARRVPHLERMIFTAADDPLSVRAETHAHHGFGVSRQRALLFTARGVPNLESCVVAAADDPLSVRTETHAQHRDLVSGQGARLMSAHRVQYRDDVENGGSYFRACLLVACRVQHIEHVAFTAADEP